jgi:hypothetical protein
MKKFVTTFVIAFFAYSNAQAQTQDSTSSVQTRDSTLKKKNLKEVSFGVMGTVGLSYYPPLSGFYTLSPAFNIKSCYSVHHVMFDVLNSTIQTSHGILLKSNTSGKGPVAMNVDIYLFGQKSTKNAETYFSLGIESSLWLKDFPQFEIVPFVEIGTENLKFSDFKSLSPLFVSVGITLQPRWLLVNNECD